MRSALLLAIALLTAIAGAQTEKAKATLIKDIRKTFQGVSRKGGVSWSEADIIDAYGTMAERNAARAKDKDKSWAEVLNDPKWKPDVGVGGWSFLDAIGFRYYLPAAMIRAIHEGYSEAVCFHLELPKGKLREYQLDQWSRLDRKQRLCVKRFIVYMMNMEEAEGGPIHGWKEAFLSYWHQVR